MYDLRSNLNELRITSEEIKSTAETFNSSCVRMDTRQTIMYNDPTQSGNIYKQADNMLAKLVLIEDSLNQGQNLLEFHCINNQF